MDLGRSRAGIRSCRATRVLFACTHCHWDLSWQFGPKMNEEHLTLSLHFLMCFPTAGISRWGLARQHSSPRFTAEAPARRLPRPEPKQRAAVPSSVCSGHPSSKPAQMLKRAFSPCFWVGRHFEEWHPRRRVSCGAGTGLWHCPCCPAALPDPSCPVSVPTSVCLSGKPCLGAQQPQCGTSAPIQRGCAHTKHHVNTRLLTATSIHVKHGSGLSGSCLPHCIAGYLKHH